MLGVRCAMANNLYIYIIRYSYIYQEKGGR